MADTKWKVVISKSPTKRELSAWTEKQWITFLRFCEFYIVTKEDGKVSISITKEKWAEGEEVLKMPDHPFHEFLYRINFFTFDSNASQKKFYFKLVSMMKFILGYLRVNPSLVSDEMKKIIEPNPRLNWCLKQTKVIETAIGDIVVPDKMDRVEGDKKGSNQNIASYEQQLQESMIKTTNLLDRLVGEAAGRPLNKMETKDLLMAIGRMSWVFSAGRQMKPNQQIFNQINIHKSSREELESAILNFNKTE